MDLAGRAWPGAGRGPGERTDVGTRTRTGTRAGTSRNERACVYPILQPDLG